MPSVSVQFFLGEWIIQNKSAHFGCVLAREVFGMGFTWNVCFSLHWRRKTSVDCNGFARFCLWCFVRFDSAEVSRTKSEDFGQKPHILRCAWLRKFFKERSKTINVLRNYLTTLSISNFRTEDFNFFWNFAMKIIAQKNDFLKVFEMFLVNHNLKRVKSSPK